MQVKQSQSEGNYCDYLMSLGFLFLYSPLWLPLF